MIRLMVLLGLSVIHGLCHAQQSVNIYIWGGVIPSAIIREFTKATGIKVNVATYDNNETLFAKLSTNTKPVYDVILPSAYFVERMQRHNLLTPIDKTQLPNYHNLASNFTNNAYDPGNQYSIPIIWGATGIAYNSKKIKSPPHAWRDLWSTQFINQLMLLDDARDVFALTLLSLNFSPNDHNPEHLKLAFDHLLALKNNIKLFASEGIQTMLIDEDVSIAAAWSGDAFKAHHENAAIQFIYPEEGFVLWVDCLALPKNLPHPKQAYAFINFILDANTAASMAKLTGHAITNQAGLELLPQSIRNNHLIYPNKDTLSRAHMQRDVPDAILRLYNHYWQALKLAF